VSLGRWIDSSRRAAVFLEVACLEHDDRRKPTGGRDRIVHRANVAKSMSLAFRDL
jgi:hypothetical protein